MSPWLASLIAVTAVSGPFTLDDLDLHEKDVVRAKNACGPVAVWYCLRRHGIDVGPDAVLDKAEIDEHGSSVHHLLGLLDSFGLKGVPVQGHPSRLGELPVPSILILDTDHCVVYEGLEPDRERVRIFEPSVRRAVYSVPLKALRVQWSGKAIVFRSPELPLTPFLVIAALSTVVSFGTMHIWMRRRRGLRAMEASANGCPVGSAEMTPATHPAEGLPRPGSEPES